MLKDVKLGKISEIDFNQDEIFIPVFENNLDKISLINKIELKDREMLLSRVNKFSFIGEKNQLFSYKNFHFTGLGKAVEFRKEGFGRVLEKIFCLAKKEKHLKLVLYISSDIQELFKKDFDMGRVVAESFYDSQYEFNKYKSDTKVHKFEELILVLEKDCSIQDMNKAFEYSKAIFSGVNLSRNLVNEPASIIHPDTLAEAARNVVAQSNGLFEIEILSEKECLKLGMNAYIAVSQGSEKPSKFIIIKFLPNKSEKSIVLIGKSLTFDSGGLSLKPAEGMEDMKIDMAGGALVLGVFKALNELKDKPKINIIGVLPACENMPSGNPVKPGDIVKALNGKTIEILNTDAEGRLTLADALAYSEKYLNPKIVIDFATLTGSIMGALGNDIAGLFGNNKDLNNQIKESALEESEYLWEMPLHEDYQKLIKSNIADLRNISKIRVGGSITASLFLKNFITDKIRWAHLDIAGVAYKKMATGWGVRTVINLLNKIV
jgi:leucyl aminopeptidase